MNKLLLFVSLFSLISFGAKSQDNFSKNKVIAHRGAWKAQGIPQNSLASLEQAVTLQCEGSEFDVWMTADGHLVVNHDADHEGLDIETTSLKELRKHKLPNGEKIPTVEEYLTKGIKQKGPKLIFEIKPSKISIARSEELATKSVAAVQKLKAEK